MLPLEDIRAVELGTAWTGPSMGMILGDLGAEVIKIDTVNYWQTTGRGIIARPTKEFLANQTPFAGGYPNRDPGKHPWNVWPVFVGQARNKLSMTVRNLKETRSRDIFLRLIKESDIFFENNHPETLDELNLNYDVLKEVNPRLIMVRLSAAGSRGPYSSYRTHGAQLDALGGHQSLHGYADMGPDGAAAVAITDYTSPTYGAMAAMIALYRRLKTGRGQLIEVSQLDALPGVLGEAYMDYFMNQRVHTRIGNRDIHGAAPCGVYPCKGKDKWVAITVTLDEEWEGLKKALGNPDWASQGQFSNALNRWKNQDALDKLVAQWTTERDRYDIMHSLQANGVPAAPIMNAADCFSDPHFQARGFFQKITHADADTHLYPGFAWKFSRNPLTIRRPPVRFGEDNEYVYKKILKVSDEEYAELVKTGEISDEPSPELP